MKNSEKEKTAKYEIVNNKWIKSNIDIDHCIKKTSNIGQFVYAIKIEAIKSIEIIISKGLMESYSISLQTGNKTGLAIYYDDKKEFEKDLMFFENLLVKQ